MLLVWALGAVLGAAPAVAAQKITNTAKVSYREQGSTTTRQVSSNTVVTQVLPAETPAKIGFLGYDPGAPGEQPIAVDGGQCRVAGGSFAALPAFTDLDGRTLDPASVSVVPQTKYTIGAPILVSVADGNRNLDPAVREYVDIDLATAAGDHETLRLKETGPDTGVFAGAIQGAATPPQSKDYDCVLSLSDNAQITAHYVDADFPTDAQTATATATTGIPTDIRLEQTASKDIVEIGDFVQYTLIVYNVGTIPANSVQIRDVLPQGLRFHEGTLWVGDAYQASPPESLRGNSGAGGTGASVQSAGTKAALVPQAGPVVPTLQEGGRTMLFNVGNLAIGQAVKATFVAEITAGASGQHLVNYAIATANGALSSNETDTVVRMVESLNTLRFTLVGQVQAVDSCDAPPEKRKGVPNVRLLLQDGTFVATDENGMYHIEGLRPGTHVVQLDPATIPSDMEAVACRKDTRFAGRADSQFVEAQGGSLWRADFYLRKKGDAVGARMQVARRDGRFAYAIDMDGGRIPVSKLRAMVALPAGATVVPGSAKLDGKPVPEPTVADGVAIFALGDPGGQWRRNLTFDVAPGGGCPAGGYSTKLAGLFEAGGSGQRMPPVELALPCDGADAPADSGRKEIRITAAAEGSAASPFAALEKIRAAVAGDSDAAGAREPGQWFTGQQPGRDLLFPAADYNPRSPTTEIVVMHLPGEKAVVSMDGQPLDPLSYEGASVSADRTMAISRWHAVPLREGDNALHVEIADASGAKVATLDRVVHYANTAARVVLVPERSVMIADGLHRPVVAVRVLDRAGRPVRQGITGPVAVSAPYETATTAAKRQAQQIGAMSGDSAVWKIEGDDGIAYIELQPTTTAGSATLSFDFRSTGEASQAAPRQDLQVWLKSEARDWVVVGFAKGSVGYDTLARNMQSLPEGEDGKGMRTEGRAAVYAKGRVLGSWLLTLAYDTGKDTSRLRNQSLMSTIDPGKYYTLYGDGTQQGYDASSARKLYLKLEREQFYALFGDFQSGLDRTELSRYQRTLNGMKVEYHGPVVEFNGFAARTSQSDMHDEIQGDGTSGLYRLKRRDIVLNSERIRIETRDRYHSEQVVASKELVRHIDYDIDYDQGTLFFREPIASRDADFNPNWIVADYETQGTGEEYLNGGGRAGVRAMGGRLEAGVSYIRDEDSQKASDLAGVDAKFHLTPRDELRAEAAASRGDGKGATADTSGNAWLVEWEHRGEMLNLLAYARRQAPGFGVGQQGGFESGMAKAGVQAQYKLGNNFSLKGEAYRQEALAQGATRDVVQAEAVYRGDGWTARGGVQWARDQAAGDAAPTAESRQVTLGATKQFLDGKLDLGVRADLGLGGGNQSVDFPDRLQLTAAYRISDAFRLLAAQEFTHGADRDTSTTRIGFEAKPWKDATLTSTLNQSQISEYGPRMFALFGLNQKFQLNDRWSLDAGVDSSQAFNESGNAPLVVDPSQPIEAGGIRDGGALTENFVALSGGVTYRSSLWMWNARLEGRQSDSGDRYGFTTAFLRQVRDGVAMSASAQAFSQANADGSTGVLANAQLSWAWRPLGSEWSMLDKLEYHLDSLSGSPVVGGSATGDGRSARLVNNFALNYSSDAWRGDDGSDGKGSVFDLYQRSQLSLYYGSKYVIASFDSNEYSGYTDLLGVEARFDVAPRIDIGLRASVIHSWAANTYAWAFGPSVGFTPFTNAWVSVGYNIRGFDDRDFNSSHYTAEGAYLVFRMKFDQHTLGLDRVAAAAGQR